MSSMSCYTYACCCCYLSISEQSHLKGLAGGKGLVGCICCIYLYTMYIDIVHM